MVGFYPLTKPILKTSVTVPSAHFTVAVWAKALLFAVYLPCIVFSLEVGAADIASARFEHAGNHYDNDNNDYPFH